MSQTYPSEWNVGVRMWHWQRKIRMFSAGRFELQGQFGTWGLSGEELQGGFARETRKLGH